MRWAFHISLCNFALLFHPVAQFHNTFRSAHAIGHNAEEAKGFIAILPELMLLVALYEHRILRAKAVFLSLEKELSLPPENEDLMFELVQIHRSHHALLELEVAHLEVRRAELVEAEVPD